MSDWDGLHICETCGDAYTTGRLCRSCAEQEMIDNAEPPAPPVPSSAGDIEAIRERLNSITPGTWQLSKARRFGEASIIYVGDDSNLPARSVILNVSAMIDPIHPQNANDANVEFIAAAPETVRTLLAAITAAKQKADALEAAQTALVNMVHDAEQECTRWQCVMEAVQDHIDAPIDSDDYQTALSLIGSAVVDVSFFDLDDNEDEIAEQRAWILKRAQQALAADASAQEGQP